MKVLFLDIETAPAIAYIWQLWDRFIPLDRLVEPGYTLCWAASWLGSNEILFDSIHKSGEENCLARIHALIEEADVVVHYNGTKFDIPTLNREFFRLGYPPPAPYKQVDLLKVARKQFRLLSNKMDYVAKYVGIDGKKEHKGMSLWTGCMEGDPKSWRIMEAYNRQDVKVLKALYKKLLPWIHNHPVVGLYSPKTRPTCPSCGSTHVHLRGTSHTRTGQYKRYQCQKCNTWSRARVMDKVDRSNVLVRDNG